MRKKTFSFILVSHNLFFFIFIMIPQTGYGTVFKYQYNAGSVIYVETNTFLVNRVDGKFNNESHVKEISCIKVNSLKNNRASLTAKTYILERGKYSNKKYYKVRETRNFTYKKDVSGKTYGLDFVEGFHDFPLFSSRDIQPGDAWTAPAFYNNAFFRKYFPLKKLDTMVSYRYTGKDEKSGEILISANAVITHKNIFGAPLAKTGGYNNFLIRFNPLSGQCSSLEEVFDYFYLLSDLSILETSGTSKTVIKITGKPEEKVVSEIREDSSSNVEVNPDHSISITLENIRFKANSSELMPESIKRLGKIAKILLAYKKNPILITGHTAAAGNPVAEQRLSEQRAKVVLEFLILNYPLNPSLLSYRGKGSTDPAAGNTTEAGKAQNRRVEILILPG